MPYQGSAQSVGFRQRTVLDPSRRMRQEAEQIERQGQERVRGMERQASQQIEEMRRVSDIQASNADYELRALSKFSTTLQRTLEGPALDIVQEQKEEAIARGKRLYLEQGPEYKAEQEEVKSASNLSYDLHVKADALASKQPTEEGQDRVRKLSRWEQHGWHLAAMKQAGSNFGTHLYAELESNTDEIIDPETGEKFVVKDYKGSSQRDAAVNYIQSNYIKNNNPAGLSDKVVNTVLLPDIIKATQTQDKEYQSQLRVENATARLDQAQNDLHQALDGNPAAPNINQAINGFLQIGANAYRRLGTPGSPAVAARKDLLEQINNRIKANPAEAETLIEALKGVKLVGHPAGEKSLFELYGDEFNEDNMRATAIEARLGKFKNQEQESLMDATVALRASKEALDGATAAERQFIIQQYEEKYGIHHPTLAADLRTHTPAILSVEASEAKAQELLAQYGGEIPQSETTNMDASVVAKYEGSIVDKVFGADSKSEFITAEKKIDGEIRSAVGATDTTSTLGYDAYEAARHAKNAMRQRARQLYQIAKESGQPISQATAIQQAADEVSQQIRQESRGNDTTAVFHRGSGTSFTNFGVKKAGVTDQLIKYQAKIDNAKALINKDPNALINTNLNLDPAELELNAKGQPSRIFFSLSRLDGNRTAYELLNAQREFYPNLPKIEPPNEAAVVQGLLDRNPDLKPLFLSHQSYNRVNRGLQQVGAVSVPTLLRALSTQESGGNYKAYNSSAYGPSNPALGKYQMLWSNIVVWGPRYGLGHPGSMKNFQNSPEYQERMAEAVMTEYLRQALNASNGNMEEAIRRAAAFWYGGADGFKNWNNPNFSGGQGYPNMESYTRSVYTHYLRGR